ncbi:unnamed protein product [marine sediment metagenome]|uniref:Uncharacterized protein n=1 Tax=marine sediment metagenome TaxID=412755 RepID=X1L1S1_9ZZZZ
MILNIEPEMVTKLEDSMQRMAFRITESAASTYTQESKTTPVVPELKQAMVIHKIVMRLSRGVRANAGVTDAHGGINKRSFDAEPDFDDADIIFQMRGNSIFLTATGEPDYCHAMIKEVDYEPHPLVYVKRNIYAYSRAIASTATQNTEIDIFYTVAQLSDKDWIAAISEGL